MAQWISNRKDQLKSFAYGTDKGQEIKMAKNKVFPFRDTFPAVQCHSHPREEETHPLKPIRMD